MPISWLAPPIDSIHWSTRLQTTGRDVSPVSVSGEVEKVRGDAKEAGKGWKGLEGPRTLMTLRLVASI